MEKKHTMWGLLAEYDSPAAVYKACEKVRDAGYKKWDACTPFPVHGLDKAMGLKASVLPWYVLGMAIIGCTLMFIFMIWASAYDYPLNISGKPTWSIPAFVPVGFEVTILFSALTTAFGIFVLSKLPRWNHPAFSSQRFERVTDDKFFIMIQACDGQFQQAKTEQFLKETGASVVEVLREEA